MYKTKNLPKLTEKKKTISGIIYMPTINLHMYIDPLLTLLLAIYNIDAI